MSKRVKMPNGTILDCSDKVAAILAARPGHALLDDGAPEPMPEPEPADKPARKKKAR